MKTAAFIVTFLLLISGCKQQEKKGYETDFNKYFANFKGAFVLYDFNNRYYIRHNDEQCKKRFSPCSTFKIPNSLIGLETGVIRDENFTLNWDGIKRQIESWNRDHNLKSAIQNSVVWYYQEVARRVGESKMKEFIDKIGYGNNDISGGIDKFWLMNSLEISAEEQVDFLKKFYSGQLPFSDRIINIVKNVIVLDSNKFYVLRGKTGSGAFPSNNDRIGWYIGYVTLGDNVFIFATNILGDDANGIKAKEITIEILKSMKIM
jgi:beta-lactamase class D